MANGCGAKLLQNYEYSPHKTKIHCRTCLRISNHCHNCDQGKTQWAFGWPRKEKCRLRRQRNRSACCQSQILSSFSCESAQRLDRLGFLGPCVGTLGWGVELKKTECTEGEGLGSLDEQVFGLLCEQAFEAKLAQFPPHILLWCWKNGLNSERSNQN